MSHWEDDDDDNAGEEWKQQTPEDRARELMESWKAAQAEYDRAADIYPDEDLRLFGCELSRTDIQLAKVFLTRFKKLESACNALRAVDALRNMTGDGQLTSDPRTTEWNDRFAVGQLVQVWPVGRNGDSFLARTKTPAFDTFSGPCVIVDSQAEAVPLFNVVVSNSKSPEVQL